MRFLIQDVPAEHASGCDIDAQAIAWDQTNLPGPAYHVIGGQPPTPYPNGGFDLVFGISVFTHLDESTQFRWLDELRRITAPDGLVAVSVLGPHATHPMHREKIERAGFLDQRSAQAGDFAAYVGEDYYRLTYHTHRYIERAWSQYFDLVEYSEFGVNAQQDLIIMRQKPA
jgi:SAM-dependent methyltransferase